MPITINPKLPAATTLAKENIFVMGDDRAKTQDIRPLRIAVLNIMPTKEQTETQLIRLLANSPLQVEIVLLHPETHVSKNTSAEYLRTFYKTFSDIKHEKYDGLIITGAPVEQIPFEEVNYWDELKEILEWSKKNVYSTMHICWAAQAGLYYHYGIKKYMLEEKLSGIFEHSTPEIKPNILRGFDDSFFAPHSRHTEVRKQDIINNEKLTLLCEGKESGVYIVSARNGRQLFVTGHPEYTKETLKGEYVRDINKGMEIEPPKNYFTDDDMEKEIVVKWRGHANLLFNNWLNYYVYQETPYDLAAIKNEEENI